MHPVQVEIERRGRLRGGLRLLSASDALEVLKEHVSADVRLLGIDAIRVTETYTQPVMELSRDFSATGLSQSDAILEACRIVKANCSTPHLFFELVVDCD